MIGRPSALSTCGAKVGRLGNELRAISGIARNETACLKKLADI
jgi:hypothetical protein